MDTIMSVKVYGEGSHELCLEAEREIYRLERLFSAEEEGSEVCAVNSRGNVQMSADTLNVIDCAIQMQEATCGAFDISVYPLVKEWGFISGEFAVPQKARIEELLTLTGSDILAVTGSELALTKENAQIGLGAIAKGYASDKVAQLLRSGGVSSAIINLGGNVYALGAKPDGSPWKVAITDPHNIEDIIGTLEVSDCAVVSSGGYQRYFEENGVSYHHILDPKTGFPAQSGLAGVTVVSVSGMLADGLSTALFVMGEDAALEFWRSGAYDFELVLVTISGDVIVSEGLRDVFSGGGFEVALR
jgi:thiamine biosynthesis lipoprotein